MKILSAKILEQYGLWHQTTLAFLLLNYKESRLLAWAKLGTRFISSIVEILHEQVIIGYVGTEQLISKLKGNA